jgi:hypothetical protein
MHVGAPQTLGVPPPPHTPVWHWPQSSGFPQPSPVAPQFTPSEPHVAGTQGFPLSGAQTLGVPPTPQDCPCGHIPQSRRLLHPSLTAPQLRPNPGHVAGIQFPVPVPQTLGVPSAPHVSPEGQSPQSKTPPQTVSVTAPQFFPTSAHDGCEHPAAPLVPDPPTPLPPAEVPPLPPVVPAPLPDAPPAPGALVPPVPPVLLPSPALPPASLEPARPVDPPASDIAPDFPAAPPVLLLPPFPLVPPAPTDEYVGSSSLTPPAEQPNANTAQTTSETKVRRMMDSPSGPRAADQTNEVPPPLEHHL